MVRSVAAVLGAMSIAGGALLGVGASGPGVSGAVRAPDPVPTFTGAGRAAVVGMVSTYGGTGGWFLRSGGRVSPYGNAPDLGEPPAAEVGRSRFVAIAGTPMALSQGYWLVAGDGGVFAFGGASLHGSAAGWHLNAPVVGMAPTEDGQGYWLVAKDGGVFAFGDAPFYGSMAGQHLNAPIVGIAPDWATGGYWEVGADGGVFSFHAPFYGSMGGRGLSAPVVGMAAAQPWSMAPHQPLPTAYWLVARDGGVFSFGDAPFYGSVVGRQLRAPVVGVVAPAFGWASYRVVLADGQFVSPGGAYGR